MYSTDKRRRLAAPLAGILVAILAWSPHLWGQRPAARRLPVDLEAIVDVDGDAAGRLYVIEDRRNRLLVLDSTFAIVAEVPNDPSDSATVVMAQRAIRVLDRGRFVRLERYLRRLDVFEWRGRKVAKVRATRFPFELWDACHAGGDTLVVVGPYRGMRLHTVLMTGQILKSFAPVDSALPKAISKVHASGGVACDARARAVAYQSGSQPVLEVFSRLSGDRTFRGGFPPSHRAISVSYDSATGGRTISSGPEGIHVPRRPELVGDTLEVQARLTAMGTWRDTVLVHRFARTDGRYLGTRIERQLRFALSDGRRLIVSLDGSERPRVERGPRPTVGAAR